MADSWDQSESNAVKFINTQRREVEIQHYLRDALEVPYWEFMLDLFLGWRANAKHMAGEIVLRVLHSLKLEILDARRHLLNDIKSVSGQEKLDISVILKGIDARINILESVWDSQSSSAEATHHSLVLFLENATHPVATVEPPLQELQKEHFGRHQMVVKITLRLGKNANLVI